MNINLHCVDVATSVVDVVVLIIVMMVVIGIAAKVRGGLDVAREWEVVIPRVRWLKFWGMARKAYTHEGLPGEVEVG